MAYNPKILCIGDALIDEIHDGDTSRRFAGGSGLLMAIDLHLLGVPTSLVTALGEDADGRWLRGVLDSYGIPVHPGVPMPETGVATSTRNSTGVPEYAFNAAMRKRVYDITPEVRQDIREARAVVVNSFPFDDRNQAEALVEATSHSIGMRIVDANPRPALLTDILAFSANFERFAATADLVSLSERDTDLLYGIEAVSLGKRLIDLGTRAVLITQGVHGVTLLTSSGLTIHHPIVGLPGAVVDTMGASTAVLASVISTLYHEGRNLGEQQWREALATSQLIAAATCRTVGGILEIPTI